MVSPLKLSTTKVHFWYGVLIALWALKHLPPALQLVYRLASLASNNVWDNLMGHLLLPKYLALE